MSDKLKLSEEIRRGDYEDFHLFILADKVLALEKENEGMRNEPKMGIIVENKNLKSQLQKLKELIIAMRGSYDMSYHQLTQDEYELLEKITT